MEAVKPIRRDELIMVRPGAESDLAFIIQTWIETLRANSTYRHIPKHILYENYKPFLNRLLKKDQTKTTIACLREEPGLIIGFAVSNGSDTLHYVYVRDPWRRIGIATQIVSRETKYVTHITNYLSIDLKEKKHLIFDPFKL